MLPHRARALSEPFPRLVRQHLAREHNDFCYVSCVCRHPSPYKEVSPCGEAEAFRPGGRALSQLEHDASYTIGVNVGHPQSWLAMITRCNGWRNRKTRSRVISMVVRMNRRQCGKLATGLRRSMLPNRSENGSSSGELETPMLKRQIRAVRTMRDLLLASEHCPLTGEFYTPGAFALLA